VDPDRLRAGTAIVASWGLRIELAEHVLAVDDHLSYLAGADALRAADFTAAWTDPEVAAGWTARGGYGCQRMLDVLDWPALRAAAPKQLIGFSDVTALHGRLGRELGQVTIHGPGAASVAQMARSAARDNKSPPIWGQGSQVQICRPDPASLHSNEQHHDTSRLRRLHSMISHQELRSIVDLCRIWICDPIGRRRRRRRRGPDS
jgi:muramoyltetrapeptide carboxypeptidase